MKKLFPLWLKKNRLDDANEKRLRLRESEIIVFNLLDIDGDGILNLYDLFLLNSHFHDESYSTGRLVHSLLDYYVDKNIANSDYGDSDFAFTFDNFKRHCMEELQGVTDLARDLIQIFTTQF
jgi:hypothetical protein